MPYSEEEFNIMLIKGYKCDLEAYYLLRDCSIKKELNPWNEWREKTPDKLIYLQGADLSNFYMFKGNLKNINFRGANCQGANFYDTNCQKADFLKAHCQGAMFIIAHCEETDFMGAHCQEGVFIGANCQKAIFFKVDCQGANFSNAECQGANFSSANFQKADFFKAECQKTNFSFAKCQEANFPQADCQGANFTQAECQGAIFRGAECQEAIFILANCQKADFIAANCEKADFIAANCEKADFIAANCQKADFSNANCQKADFSNANCQKVDFSNAKCEEAFFYRANLQGIKLVNAVLNKAQIINCEIDDETDFSNSNLNAVIIEPGTKAKLEQNIRHKNWQHFCKQPMENLKNIIYRKVPEKSHKNNYNKKLKPTLREAFNAVCQYPFSWIFYKSILLFWWISDYGYSIKRVFGCFFAIVFFFASIYYLFPQILAINTVPLPEKSNIFQQLLFNFWDISLRNESIRFLQMFTFSLSSMVTLGFSNINVAIIKSEPNIWGLIVVSCNLMVGYFMLAVLVTRLAVLFQSLAPGIIINKSNKKPTQKNVSDKYEKLIQIIKGTF